MRLNLPIGQAWMEAKYAPTGRATCKRCENKIEKGELRLTNIADEDHFRSEMHYHVDCFQIRPYFKDAKYTDIFYVDELKPDDQEVVEQQFQKLLKKQTGNKVQSKKKKASIDSDSDFEIKNKALQQQQQKLQDESEDDMTESDYFSLYNEEQIAEFKKKFALANVFRDSLFKELLRKNGQKSKGDKAQVIRRVIDCQILGCIGKCPKCLHGRPKLVKGKKLFKCPGYKEGKEFKKCNKVWKPSELPRTPWIQ